MKPPDYITIHDKDDPPYIYIGHVYILGNWWVVYILLVDHRDLSCKAKGDFTPERQLNMNPILRFDSVVSTPVVPGLHLKGKASSYTRTGETGRLPVHGWGGHRARRSAKPAWRLPGTEVQPLSWAQFHPREAGHRHPQGPPGTALERDEEKPAL